MKTFPLVYYAIPEQLQKALFGQVDFAFDPAIPLPVELPSGIVKQEIDYVHNKELFDISNIRPEMIFSGILQELAKNPDGNNSTYYRNLIFAVRPSIGSELQEAAIVKAGNGDYESALEIFELLSGLKVQDDVVFTEAVALLRNGDEEHGIIKAKNFLERHPQSGRGWFVLGWGLRCLSRWDHAVECFKKALTLGCVNADTYNELAICLLETGDLAAAEKELKKALHIDPENVKIISNMGILAMKQGDSEKAAAFFRTVLELDPGDPVAAAYVQREL